MGENLTLLTSLVCTWNCCIDLTMDIEFKICMYTHFVVTCHLFPRMSWSTMLAPSCPVTRRRPDGSTPHEATGEPPPPDTWPSGL